MSIEKFWDQKLERWDNKSYPRPGSLRDLILPNPIAHRLNWAANALGPRVSGKSVLELGCGSGRLLGELVGFHPSSLIGIDISGEAVDLAKIRQQQHLETQMRFLKGDALEVDWPASDFVCGLGLIDWLDHSEIQKFFAKCNGRDFIVSFSEMRFSPQVFFHRALVFLSYGYKSRGYVPRYYDANQIAECAKPYGFESVYFFRDKNLAFGTFATSFEIE